jgi:1,4-alpha-glucan branching enzyme
MGGEFGQWREWNHDNALDWHLTDQPDHRGLQRWVADLNALYRREPALHQRDFSPEGFEWIDANDSDNSVLSFVRHGDESGRSREGGSPSSPVLVICNFTPVPRHGYRVGLPKPGAWREVMNSDAPIYGGSGVGNMGRVESEAVSWHGRAQSALITIPPLGVVMFTPEGA